MTLQEPAQQVRGAVPAGAGDRGDRLRGGSDSGQPGSGVVRGIDTANAQITLEQGDIPR